LISSFTNEFAGGTGAGVVGDEGALFFDFFFFVEASSVSFESASLSFFS